jgi:hypothetical protein
MMSIKKIDIKEFRELGYLQELNRRFLHPLGLALEVAIDDNGTDTLGGIWDYREDEEGFYYDLEHSIQDRRDRFRTNKDFIDKELSDRLDKRRMKIGFGVEPIDNSHKINV